MPIYTFHFYEPFLFTHQLTSWNFPASVHGQVPFPFEENMPEYNPLAEDTWGKTLSFNYSTQGNIEYLYHRLLIAKHWAENRDVPLLCGEWGSYHRIEVEDRCRYTKTMINLFAQLEIPNLFWDWDQNFSLIQYSETELDPCMLDALIPDPEVMAQIPLAKVSATLYPNPAQDYIYVNLPESKAGDRMIIYNSLGQELYNTAFLGNHNSISIIHFSEGMYLIEIRDAQGLQKTIQWFAVEGS